MGWLGWLVLWVLREVLSNIYSATVLLSNLIFLYALGLRQAGFCEDIGYQAIRTGAPWARSFQALAGM